jgi:hypothetical protein
VIALPCANAATGQASATEATKIRFIMMELT